MEQVLVVHRELLFGAGRFHGCIPLAGAPRGGAQWLDVIGRHARFAPRPEVETDPGRKQIIPYAVVLQGERILLLRRLAGGGEHRLHHMLSVGVGGHINPKDSEAGADPLLAGARRELLEEIDLSAGTMGIVGFVNDDTNQVGSVHFGVVFRVDMGGAPPVSREPRELHARMEPLEEILARFRREPGVFETWSRLVLGAWDELMQPPVPAPFSVP